MRRMVRIDDREKTKHFALPRPRPQLIPNPLPLASTLAAQVDACMATARAARAAAAKGDAKIATANGAEPSYATSTTGRHLAATPTRALIGPHAGYSYCAHVLAHAYAGVEAGRVRRAFVLGPSHHVYSKEATISGVEACATPLGALAVDDPTRAALLATSAFGAATTPLAVDEAEHSLELHLPFLASALGARPGIPASIPIIPIVLPAQGTPSDSGFQRAQHTIGRDPARRHQVG